MDLKNKRILVTGADGFIGSHLTEMLVQQGGRVKALSYYNSLNSWGWLEDISCQNEVEIVSGDVRDSEFCKKLTKDVDVVFNLAALIAIPYSYSAPQSYIDTNVYGTLNICQGALENKCQRIIQISTSEVYGSAKYVPIDEQHPLQPQSPYSASKISSDSVAMSFHYSFELPLILARPFNTYGPRQSARAVIPTIIAQLANNVKEVKLGDTSTTRDFNYVLDTCKGLIQLAGADAAIGQVVNIGSNTEITIKDLFETIRDILGVDASIMVDASRTRPVNSEVQRLRCDNRKLVGLTGFAPDFSLKEGLERTIEWFKKPENLRKYKHGIYNV